MWPTCESHVFTCVPHVLFQFHTFAHMWSKCFTCETHVRSSKHMCISCVPHVTHKSPHMITCEAHVGSYLLALRSHVERTCEIGTTHTIHMWISCDFSVRDRSLASVTNGIGLFLVVMAEYYGFWYTCAFCCHILPSGRSISRISTFLCFTVPLVVIYQNACPRANVFRHLRHHVKCHVSVKS